MVCGVLHKEKELERRDWVGLRGMAFATRDGEVIPVFLVVVCELLMLHRSTSKGNDELLLPRLRTIQTLKPTPTVYLRDLYLVVSNSFESLIAQSTACPLPTVATSNTPHSVHCTLLRRDVFQQNSTPLVRSVLSVGLARTFRLTRS